MAFICKLQEVHCTNHDCGGTVDVDIPFDKDYTISTVVMINSVLQETAIMWTW
jgi:hypothetical protein